MHLPSHPLASRRIRRAVAAPLASALGLLAVSCASPGPPKPPSLHLVRIPTDLKAERVGDEVRLTWTTAKKTTDDLPVPSTLTAELCRETGPAPLPDKLPPCAVVTRTPVKPGPSEVAEALPHPLATGEIDLLRYRVRILNPNNRAAGDTKAVVAASGPAPAPVLGLHARSSRGGGVLTWTRDPSESPAVVELIRDHQVPPKAEKKSAKTPGSSDTSGTLDLGPEEPDQARLRSSELIVAPPADPGGTVDAHITRGESYTYRAQRVRLVTINGRTLELRSPLSAPVTLVNTDVFPPASPTGLATVPSASEGKAAIDLSWQPNTETDLSGYNIYRRQPDGSFKRLNPALLPGPAYTDAAVTAGSSYTYRVTAVDGSGNEGPPSAVATETAAQP